MSELGELNFSEVTAKHDVITDGHTVVRKGDPYYVADVVGSNTPVRLSLAEYEVQFLGLRDVSVEERKSLAKKGQTLSKKGNYPVASCSDLKNARQAVGRSRPSDRERLKSYLNRLNSKMNCGFEPL